MVRDIENSTINNIIKAVEDKVGIGKLLGLRRKNNNEFELTMESEKECEILLNGLMINGEECEMKKLCATEKMVSFLNLPSYIQDEEIQQKLSNWGVTPILPIRRKYHPGTMVADGTRFVRVKFPKEVKSLPYNVGFMTEEGMQYFRVIHDNQLKMCRLCSSTEHEKKDCPNFTCRRCLQQGHYVRDCEVPQCQGCERALTRCNCEKEEEVERMEIQASLENTATERKEDKTGEEKNTEENRNEQEDKEMELGEGANKEEGEPNNRQFADEQYDEDTTELNIEERQEKTRTEDNEIRAINEVRGMDFERGNYGLEKKEKGKKIKDLKSRSKSGLNIEMVLQRQKIRREEIKERMERKKFEKGDARNICLSDSDSE